MIIHQFKIQIRPILGYC